MDELPPDLDATQVEVAPAEEVEPHLPSEAREDGSVVIDLMPLAPVPTDDCALEEPDPFQSEIIVCRTLDTSPRLGPAYGPTADEVVEGSAVPRASFRLSDDAEVQLNAANNAVGGFNANGGEVRVKIDF